MFTYHKYLKSIQSTVPLDGHGNPIVEEEMGFYPDGDGEAFVELDERVPLREDRENQPVSSRSLRSFTRLT